MADLGTASPVAFATARADLESLNNGSRRLAMSMFLEDDFGFTQVASNEKVIARVGRIRMRSVSHAQVPLRLRLFSRSLRSVHTF